MPSRASRPRNPRNVSPREFQPERRYQSIGSESLRSEPLDSQPVGSRRVVAGLLRGLGQRLEQWADRLEATITQVTATLPDPRVRKDLLAKLWRVWLTIGSQMVRRLPSGWGTFLSSALPIGVGLLLLLLMLWVSSAIFQGKPVESTFSSEDVFSNPTEAIDRSSPSASPSINFAVEDSGNESPIVSDPSPETNETQTDQTPSPYLTPEMEISPQTPPEINPQDELGFRDPLGPPVPDWSRLSSPLAQSVQAKILAKLSASGQALVQRIQVNFKQQELTIYLTDQWQTLTPLEQHQLVEMIQTQAQQLDFPHLRFVDEQDRLLARTAIIGQGIIFQ